MSGSINKVVGGAAAATAGASCEADRRLMVDRSFFENQFLTCQVCLERFDQGERAPKSLPCNHTFCLRCVNQLFDHAQPSVTRNRLEIKKAVKCPTCRSEVFLSRGKIKDLPNEHRVIQMMDFLCPKHGQPLSFFCKKCYLPVCRDCTVIDHQGSEGHVIINLSEATTEYSEQITEMEKQSKKLLEKMNARSGPLANVLRYLDYKNHQLHDDIDKTFATYRLLLEQRQAALKVQVSQIFESQKTKINAQIVNVGENKTLLQELYEEFKSSKDNNDIRKLFTTMHQIKNHQTVFTEVAATDVNDCLESCEFKTQSEGSFLRELNSLGKVQSEPGPNESFKLWMPFADLEIILLGKTGVGKSKTANTILGRKAFSSKCMHSTTTCQREEVRLDNGRILGVMNTPGVGDTRESMKREEKLFMSVIHDVLKQNLAGFYAFVLVLRFGSRFTSKDLQTIKNLKKVFGEDFVAKHCIIVMTHGDDFLRAQEDGDIDVSFMEWCKDYTGTFQVLFAEVQERILLFNNRGSLEEKAEMRNELVAMIDRMALKAGLFPLLSIKSQLK